ncbi:MAG TPA: hypothetical protein VGT24_09880 [Candidatus Acidoferrales bacterium]|nr:hypothetical protein [Candidatus Acidoferrales bacterium]
MSATQPLLRSARSIRVRLVTRRLTFLLLAAFCGTLLLSSAARAQSGPLITIATDKNAPNVSSKFGAPVGSGVSGTGTYAFVGDEGSALFYRPAGAGVATLLLQNGEQVPTISGTQVETFTDLLGPNSKGVIAFVVAYSLGDGLDHRAILIYNGSAYQTIATSDQVAPGTGGKTFGVPLKLYGLNDNNDIAFITPLTPFFSGTGVQQTTLFLAPAAGTPVRIAGENDSVPGTPGGVLITGGFNRFGFNALGGRTNRLVNSAGQVIFETGVLVGGVQQRGLFLGVVSGGTGSFQAIAVSGNAKPGGGTFANPHDAFLNDAGEIAFLDAGSPWTWTQATGLSAVTLTGLPVPVPSGVTGSAGTTSGPLILFGLDDIGDILFTASITGTGAFTDSAGLRVHPGTSLGLIGYDHETAPGISGKTFAGNGFATSTASNGTVTFGINFAEGGFGLYQQTGTSAPVLIVADGQTAPASVGGTFSISSAVSIFFGTQTLGSNSTFFIANIVGGTAYYGEFLATTSGNTVTISPLMSTADVLPAVSGVIVGAAPLDGPFLAGHFAAFTAQQAGGAVSLFVMDRTSGVTTRIVTEGDPAPGGGGTIGLSFTNTYFYLNGN